MAATDTNEEPAVEALPPPVEAGEASPEADAPPALIRVPSSGPRRPLLYAAVAVPLLALSFFGAMFFARGQAKPPEAHAVHWAYEGDEGPERWAELDPHNQTCALGEQQSPIDISPARLMQVDWLIPIELRYRPAKAQLLNNGHTFQVNYGAGSRMTFLNQEYELVQFHFHTPSEHLINGQRAAMELHLVHATPDESKRLAVLGVMIAEGPENPFLAKFWGQMPEKEGPPVKTDITINAQDVLPRNARYFYYDGSLTTPPCTERVRWVVLRENITASKEQISKFKNIFHENSRPPQPIKERYVFEDIPVR